MVGIEVCPKCCFLSLSQRSLPNLNNSTSTKLRTLLHRIQEEDRKGQYVQLQIIRKGEPMERQFLSLLVEDAGQGDMDYPDFLCHVHKQIQVSMQD